MKLNNHGWGFKEMFIMIVILVAFLMLAVYLIYIFYHDLKKSGVDLSNNFDYYETKDGEYKPKSAYEDLEIRIKNATVKYMKNYYSNELSDSVVITVKDLKQTKLITNLKDLKDLSPCTGYVIVTYRNERLRYEPYINCNNYHTSGYRESYDKK